MFPGPKAILATWKKRPSETQNDPRLDKHPRYETINTTTITTTAISGETSNGADLKQVDRARRLRGVNHSVMGMFKGTLRRDPTADLSSFFESYAQIYPDRRRRAEERALKARTTLMVPTPHQPVTSQDGPLLPSPKNSRRLSREAKDTLKVPIGTPTIIRPLAPSVLALFTNHNASAEEPTTTNKSMESNTNSVIREELTCLLTQGELLWYISGKAVVKLSPTIAVKLGTDMDLDQAEIMTHVLQQTTKVPIPEPLGVLSIANTVYIFMSHIAGTPLEKHWPSMTLEQKCTIRAQLNVMLSELREVPLLPEGFCFGWNNYCKDTRRTTRKSGLITTEAEFNKFLLSSPLSGISSAYLEMMAIMLREDHRIVLTHGDLNPGNIMVIVEGKDFMVTGLIDWEMSGWYPEYWEHVKALSSFSRTSDDDWWEYLPESVGLYHAEWALDCQIDTIIIPDDIGPTEHY